jgi:hypothetical protein
VELRECETALQPPSDTTQELDSAKKLILELQGTHVHEARRSWVL